MYAKKYLCVGILRTRVSVKIDGMKKQVFFPITQKSGHQIKIGGFLARIFFLFTLLTVASCKTHAFICDPESDKFPYQNCEDLQPPTEYVTN